jgi:hypothetical protein
LKGEVEIPLNLRSGNNIEQENKCAPNESKQGATPPVFKNLLWKPFFGIEDGHYLFGKLSPGLGGIQEGDSM